VERRERFRLTQSVPGPILRVQQHVVREAAHIDPVFIGLCEGLGGVALIVPAMTRVEPKLTPIAAAGLTLIMILAAAFHIARGEASFFVPLNLVLGGAAALIAYGRFAMPIAPAPLPAGTLRILIGTAVLGVLICAGFGPVFYQYYMH